MLLLGYLPEFYLQLYLIIKLSALLTFNAN